MKKSNSFAYYLSKYLTIYLPGERGLATNSILSYRDTFSLLLDFLKTEKQLRPEQLPMSFLDRELVVEFARWLETSRHSSISTRNQRVGAIRAFCKWLAYENPEFLILSAELEQLKLKKIPKKPVNYLSIDAIQHLLSQPDSSTKNGLRDLLLLALAYDTGARVSEVINLKFRDIRFSSPATITLTGKGSKTRIVPLLPQTLEYLRHYAEREKIDLKSAGESYVFTNRTGTIYTRAGIKYILDKYVVRARSDEPGMFCNTVSPHVLRHSKAMHLLQAGNNVVYIRDILGHADLNTTERYAKADTAMKREALTKAEIPMPVITGIKTARALDSINHSVEDDMAEWLREIGLT